MDLALASGLARQQVAAMVNWWNDIALPAGTSYRGVDSTSILGSDPRTFVDGGPRTASGDIAAAVATAAAAGKFRVVGHSLGGHLTTVFATLFHDQVSHSSTFNGAGLFSGVALSGMLKTMLAGSPMSELGSIIGRQPVLPDKSTQDNFFAAQGLNFATNDATFMQAGERLPVYNEYTSELSLSPIRNHFQYKLTDSLALFRAFEALDPGVRLPLLASVAQTASDVQPASLERTLDALRRAVLGPNVAATPASDDGGDWEKSIMPQARIDYHQNLQALQDSAAYKSLAAKVDVVALAGGGASAIAREAAADFGAFVALRDLSPFALRAKAGVAGADAALAGVWQATRGAEFARWQDDAVAGIAADPEAEPNFSAAWYADRAAMLDWQLRRNADDGPPSSARQVATPLRFDDRTTGTMFDIAPPNIAYPSVSKITFGRDDAADVLSGDGKADRLYGGGGADTLNGDAGDDYLEGNAGGDVINGGAGNDTLEGGADDDMLYGDADNDAIDGGKGRDTLEGGEGADTLRGGADLDYLRGGAGRDTLDGGTGDDILTGGSDSDTLRGGAGNDSYVFFSGDGYDVVDDADGKGSINLGAARLTGGDAVAPGLWRSGDVTYAFTAGADGRGDLTIASPTNRIVVQHFLPGANGTVGDLGIALKTYVAPALPSYNAVVGDAGDNNALDGIAGHVALSGTVAADRLQGLAGRDQLLGNAGNDLLEGGTQADVLSGADGNDRLFADALTDVRVWADAQAGLAGTAQQGDWLDGGAGDDELVGSADADAIFAGRGDDRVFAGGGNDFIFGDGEGAATNLGWHRADYADGSYALLPASYTLPSAGGADFIRAGGGNDIVNADFGSDVVYGEAGDDTIAGYEGADELYGGDGNDFIAGDMSGWQGVPEAPGAPDTIDGGAGNDEILGNGGDDLLFGGSGDDSIDGGEGDDGIDGEEGNDSLQGGQGADRIAGGDGDDVLSGGDGADTLVGEAGADTLQGGAANDVLDGGEDDDDLSGGDGDDKLDGSTGADILRGEAGRDVLAGGDGADTIDGGADDDEVSAGSGNDALWGGLGQDTLDAGDGNDRVSGNEGGDRIHAGAGDDRAAGDDGDDSLWGEAGADLLWGGAGDDTLDGGGDGDLLDGGDGRDTLIGGAGSDTLRGEDGDDVLDGGDGSDLLLGGAGNDTYVIDSSGGTDFIVDSEGDNTYALPEGVTLDNLDLRLGADEAGGANHLVVMVGGRNLAVIVGGYGGANLPKIELPDGHMVSKWELLAKLANHSKLPISEGPFPLVPPDVSADLLYRKMEQMAVWASRPDAYVPIKLPPSALVGSAGSDHLVAPGGAATVQGADGDDAIVGGYADDALDGGGGSDAIDGAAGADTLSGGEGDDRLTGGDGTDRIEGNAGNDAIDGGSDEDTLLGGDGDDTLHGGAQRDRLEGGDGSDALHGDDANDILAGGGGSDALVGGAGNDDLAGDDGDDVLDGGEGVDTLAGGAGNDLLQGGADDDVYVVDGQGSDRIRDSLGSATVRFAAGITEASFTLDRGAAGTPDEFSLGLDFGGGNRVTIEDGLRAGVGRFEFADGRSLTRAELLNARWSSPLTFMSDAEHRYVAGGSGNDTLRATDGVSAQLAGGDGNDAIEGASAADRLDGGAGADLLTGRDGDDDLRGNGGDDVLTGGAGADWMQGGAGDDVLDAGSGNDQLFGEAGDDTYVLGGAAGEDLIDDAEGRNTVRFADGISPAGIRFRHDANDLVVSLSDGSKTWIRGGYAQERITGYAFADGTTLSAAAARAAATDLLSGESLAGAFRAPVFGTDGDDSLAGDVLVGGPGNDSLRDGFVYRFGRGDGADEISHSNLSGYSVALDRKLQLAPGIALADLAFSRHGDDLVMAIRDTADRVTVKGHFAEESHIDPWRSGAGTRAGRGSLCRRQLPRSRRHQRPGAAGDVR